MKKRIKYAERKVSIRRVFKSEKEFEALKKDLREQGYMIMSSAINKNRKGYIYAYIFVNLKRL